MASPGPGTASTVTSSSAGSEATRAPPAALTEERNRKRKESNRLSAQRSRARKLLQLIQYMDAAAAMGASSIPLAGVNGNALPQQPILQTELYCNYSYYC
ncbi:unnamed protein product [Triticum turgidum subsp. durum]|uniref:BZIP domain-containing protein n=1 Tax=Triticum turgidum subsp. durum TaxID=4567 RepID=A0A9R0RM39_TRITD|nr:unnamed protein product [Triticum turgidum subsp. durum]